MCGHVVTPSVFGSLPQGSSGTWSGGTRGSPRPRAAGWRSQGCTILGRSQVDTGRTAPWNLPVQVCTLDVWSDFDP